jgi:hypothetical protein
MKTVEIQLPSETVQELLIAHLYAISYLNDDQEVTSFKFKRGIDLKNQLSFEITFETKQDELPLLAETQ